MQSTDNLDSLDNLIKGIAAGIHRRKLASPAIFMLETYKPLLTLFHQSAIVSMPMLLPFVGSERAKSLMPLLESRENIEKLIQLLEQESEKEPAVR
jgi:hypothetical protein